MRNNGRMRLVVGCTLDQPEIDATESVEFWSPGNPLFNPPPSLRRWEETNQEGRLRELLDDS